jgi:hypothetical protein
VAAAGMMASTHGLLQNSTLDTKNRLMNNLTAIKLVLKTPEHYTKKCRYETRGGFDLMTVIIPKALCIFL